MKIKGFILVDRSGRDTKFLVKPPDPSLPGQVAVPISLEIPDALFWPPKLPTVEVTIDECVLPQIRAINEHCERLQEAGVRIRLVDAKGEIEL